uniref:Uncharacterized protein n=1 Tax=Arundo donax TaxID=35708 RepID=A0A0A9ETF1_ARUDO
MREPCSAIGAARNQAMI